MTDDLLARLRGVVGDARRADRPGRGGGVPHRLARRLPRARRWPCVRPGSTAEVAEVVRALPRAAGVAVVPQGGNTGLCGGAVPDDSGTPGRAVARPHAPHARRRPRQPHDHRRGGRRRWQRCRRRPRRPAGSSRCRLGAEGSCTIGGNLSTNAGGTAVLRYGNDARPGARARGRAARRPRLGRAARPAQGQHRLRPQAALHRRRGHAGHHHRRRAEALPGRARGRRRWWRCATCRRPRSSCSASLREPPATRSSDSSSCRATAWTSSLRHMPGARDPLPGPPAGTCWSSSPDRRGAALDAHARGGARRARRRAGLASTPSSPQSPAQRAGLWALRESIPEAQKATARVKHESRAGRRVPEFVERTGRAAQRAFPGSGSSPSATSATATCTTTCGRRRGRQASCPRRGGQPHRLRRGRRLGGSISAEHGLGRPKARRPAATRATSSWS